jgi:hypothetical protein
MGKVKTIQRTPPTEDEEVEAFRGAGLNMFKTQGQFWAVVYDELNSVCAPGLSAQEAFGGALNKWYWLKKDKQWEKP